MQILPGVSADSKAEEEQGPPHAPSSHPNSVPEGSHRPGGSLTKGNQYILTYMDFCTRYPEAIPLRSTTSRQVADALITVPASGITSPK